MTINSLGRQFLAILHTQVYIKSCVSLLMFHSSNIKALDVQSNTGERRSGESQGDSAHCPSSLGLEGRCILLNTIACIR